MTDVRPIFSKNASSPIDVTVYSFPSKVTTCGMVTAPEYEDE